MCGQYRNAISTHQDCSDLVDALQRAQDDVSVSCIVLTGTGSAFPAGGNLKAMKERTGLGPLDAPDETRTNYPTRSAEDLARPLGMRGTDDRGYQRSRGRFGT
jgi:2-(1,2-epoxy-1,2-dihydrophenyl)acetyl-CoA isomerase